MMSGRLYSPELWMFLRLIYENCIEKVTLEQILDMAQRYLPNEKLPNVKSLSRKIRDEEWQKKAQKNLMSLSSQSLIKLLSKQAEQMQAYSGLNAEERKVMLNAGYEVSLNKLFNEQVFQKRKISNVLLEQRRNSYKASLYFNHKVDQLVEMEHKVLHFSEYYREHADEFEDIDFDTAFNIQLKQFKALADGIYIAESMSKTVTNLIKNDFVLYGINPDDTREPDTSKRIASLDEDVEYYAEQERLALENQQRIAERMALLQSGVYEEQVKQQALANARRYEANDDIDDAEFEEIL